MFMLMLLFILGCSRVLNCCIFNLNALVAWKGEFKKFNEYKFPGKSRFFTSDTSSASEHEIQIKDTVMIYFLYIYFIYSFAKFFVRGKAEQ